MVDILRQSVCVPYRKCTFLKKGTQAEMSVGGVRTVPYMYIYGKWYTPIIGTGTPK